MKIIPYPITDDASRTTYNGLYKIEAENGEVMFLRSSDGYNNLLDFIEYQIRIYTLRVNGYKRNCGGRDCAIKGLEMWERIKVNLS